MQNPKPRYAAQLEQLTLLGMRSTGSAAHSELVDTIADELAALGLEVHRDGHVLDRWEAPESAVSLEVGGERIPLASAWPYSGATPADGVTGRLVRLGGRRPRWADAAGAIAVVEVPHLRVPSRFLVDSWDGSTALGPTVSNPVLSAELGGLDLAAARAAGVLGVVAVWRGLPDAIAAGQYVPFTQPYHDLPAVWAPESVSDRLRAGASRGATARLRLVAALTPAAPTDTVWAVSPGAVRGESVLVITHTDGSNEVEENGHIGLLALARDAAGTAHDRTIVFAAVTGHLRIPAMTDHGQATTAWLRDHPELWDGRIGHLRAVAGLAIEHLGARAFAVDPATGAYGPTGAAEPELLYATTRELASLVRLVWPERDGASATVAKPAPLIHFGEGEPLLEHRIPAVALVTAPEYLLAELDAPTVDLETLALQIDGFRELQRRLASTSLPADALGTVRPPSRLRRAVAAVRALTAVRSQLRRD
ncbi:hypothetical protein IT072_09990 [Leifsonia sp. ZF2019]|uniref:hypothetical protein n=1 Tax=Leifsonia sp. ZF2019 TaxID=2781978 RepID=UPI001CC19A34|nr:hypothetical protein [Leifsonia sp. ZF2019]UAJ81273.1 hypothetical protein IT072_09990 [Leifsonia sp. ZF2019]